MLKKGTHTMYLRIMYGNGNSYFFRGLVIVTLSSIIPSQLANDVQNVAFFCGLYMVAFGIGGVLSSALPFGADQFNEDDPIERGKKGAFFVWRYICVTFVTLTSGTLLVWLEEYVKWTLGFSISTACWALAVGGFILGTPTYRKQMPSGSPFKSILQVLTASVMKMRLKPPMDSSLLYEVVDDKNDDFMEQEKLAHTNEFRFFDKAAVVLKSDYKDGIPQLSWTLCTKTQVEKLKLLVRFLPIWATSVLFTVAFSQMGTTHRARQRNGDTYNWVILHPCGIHGILQDSMRHGLGHRLQWIRPLHNKLYGCGVI